VGFPINAIFDWSMGTTSGYAAFLMDKVNAHLKTVLDAWGRFLASKDSVTVLNHKKTGWLGDAAFKAMAPKGTKDPKKYFEDTFVCDPDQPHYGFTSWDDFFTRRFREGARPVASPDDGSVVVNACESAPFNFAYDVQRSARFWIKGQPYSLEHMMAHDPLVTEFEFGTIYQAFLSAKSYHRWHSPVTGTIVKAYTVPGTYYSESLANRHDPAGPNDSQGYITAVAARALIFIEADDPRIGLMCFMAVGMAEVSTCQITVYEGQHVEKGEQLGSFHFGGSTHCLFFRPQTKVEFDLHGQVPYAKGGDPENIPINAKIATVSRAGR
jgi:phosphatidylserine decarboxylase